MLKGLAIDQVAFETEVVGNVGVDGCELLEGLHSPKSQHSPLSSAERQLAVLDSVVEPETRLPVIKIPKFAHRGMVGSQVEMQEQAGWFARARLPPSLLRHPYFASAVPLTVPTDMKKQHGRRDLSQLASHRDPQISVVRTCGAKFGARLALSANCFGLAAELTHPECGGALQIRLCQSRPGRRAPSGGRAG